MKVEQLRLYNTEILPSGRAPKEIHIMYTSKDMYENVHSRIIYKSPNWKLLHAINTRMDK